MLRRLKRLLEVQGLKSKRIIIGMAARLDSDTVLLQNVCSKTSDSWDLA